MNIKDFETLVISELTKIVTNIVKNNLNLKISAKSRAGAEISDFLEERFVEYTSKHKYFSNSEKAPKGATKNPWDVKTFFNLSLHTEEIWIDFKTLKVTGEDSNPDIGTPNKIIRFIKDGNFYLVYVYLYYEETETGLKFVKNGKSYTNIYFLKDINHTFRRNPKNQLQINISEPPEYRSREEFIKLLLRKIKESHKRQIEISKKALDLLDKEESELIKQNRISEIKILKNL